MPFGTAFKVHFSLDLISFFHYQSSVPVSTTGPPVGFEDGPMEFVIAFMAPWNATFEDFSALTSASAVAMAIEAVHADPTLNKKINLT